MYYRPEVIDVRKGPKMTPQTAFGRILVERRFASPPIVGLLVGELGFTCRKFYRPKS